MKRIISFSLIFFALVAATSLDQITLKFSETESYSADKLYTEYRETKPLTAPKSINSAYNPVNHEYLLVWDESASSNYVVYAQRVSATTGDKLGEKFQINHPISSGEISPGYQSSVAYDPATNRYLVVWATSLATMGQTFAQLIDGATGAKIGEIITLGNGIPYNKDVDRILILDTKTYYNAHKGEFLVAWTGRAEASLTLPNYLVEVEIYAAKVTPNGAVSAGSRVSKYGAEMDGFSRATSPSIAYNPLTNNYLIVFTGYYQSPIVVSIFAQFIDGNTLARLNTEDILLHEVSLAHITHDAGIWNPEIFYNESNNEYMLFYSGKAIYAERLSSNLVSLGKTALNFTGLGFDTEALSSFTAVYRPSHNQYAIVWNGSRDRTELEALDDYNYIYGQLISSLTGELTGVKNFRITQSSIGSTELPALSVDGAGNLFTSYIVRTKPEESGFYYNIGGKLFKPFEQNTTFDYSDSIGKPEQPAPDGTGSGITASILKQKDTAEAKRFLISCNGASSGQLSIRLYGSKNKKYEAEKDKIIKQKKLKVNKTSFVYKVKKSIKPPKFLVAECMDGASSAGMALAATR